MTKKVPADSDEFQERAATREYDGGFSRLEANQLALMDLNERKAPLKKQMTRLGEIPSPNRIEDRGQKTEGTKEIEQIRQQRDEIKRLWLAETDAARQAELAAKWQELSMKIIELKKGN